jgi:hypothetical protein
MSRQVRISYSPDLTQIGQTRELEDSEAAALVADGRAAYVEDQSALAERPKSELLDQANALGLDVSERDSRATLAAANSRAYGAATGRILSVSIGMGQRVAAMVHAFSPRPSAMTLRRNRNRAVRFGAVRVRQPKCASFCDADAKRRPRES